MAYSKEDVLRLAKEWNVKFIRLQFSDILGHVKNIALPVSGLEKALEGKIMFDGSSVEGFTRIQESDMYLKPDLDTFALFSWRSKENPVARLICDVYDSEEKPFRGCPRCILKKVIAEAEEMGFSMYAGPEPEFFLFNLDVKGNPCVETNDAAGYFDMTPVDKGEDVRRDIILALQALGFEIEASHHEVAPGQHEIDFKYTNALRTADNIATFRFVTKAIANLHGLHATFMAKPIFGISGSGMHVHQSLFRDTVNVFYDPEGELGLSQIAKYYLGGLMRHARAITAITNPTVNSYKRLVPGYEAPVYLAWSGQNRSALIRVPSARGLGSRLELRSPDPMANPYLALAVMLKAGLDGIKNKIDPGPPSSNDIYRMTDAEREAAGIYSLPTNLLEALKELEKDEVIKEALGEHVYTHFYKAKMIEWNIYRMQVSQWELDQYLRMF